MGQAVQPPRISAFDFVIQISFSDSLNILLNFDMWSSFVPLTRPYLINQQRLSGSQLPPAALASSFNSFSANAICTGTSSSSFHFGGGGVQGVFQLSIPQSCIWSSSLRHNGSGRTGLNRRSAPPAPRFLSLQASGAYAPSYASA